MLWEIIIRIIFSFKEILEITQENKLIKKQIKSKVDSPQNSIESYNSAQKSLAKKLIEKVNEEANEDQSYVLGIEAPWGQGKTSYLNLIKIFLTKYDEIISFEFKAWLNNGETKIRDEFFKVFAENILKKSPSLSRKLIRYEESLEGFNNSFFKNIKNYISLQKSSQQYFEEIREELRSKKQKILILIDDLDRMNKEEILEIFQIIRSSSNFPYLSFIILYDKENIQKELNEDSKTPAYIEKIVNCEFSLPEYDNEKKQLEFIKALQNQVKEPIRSILNYSDFENNIISDVYPVLNESLSTLREYKRFLRKYNITLNLFFGNNQISNNSQINNSIAQTLFILSLIQYKYPSVYEKIKKSDKNYVSENNNQTKLFINEGKLDTNENLTNLINLLNSKLTITSKEPKLGKSNKDFLSIYHPSDKTYKKYFEFGLTDDFLSYSKIKNEIMSLLKVKQKNYTHSYEKDLKNFVQLIYQPNILEDSSVRTHFNELIEENKNDFKLYSIFTDIALYFHKRDINYDFSFENINYNYWFYYLFKNLSNPKELENYIVKELFSINYFHGVYKLVTFMQNIEDGYKYFKDEISQLPSQIRSKSLLDIVSEISTINSLSNFCIWEWLYNQYKNPDALTILDETKVFGIMKIIRKNSSNQIRNLLKNFFYLF